MAVAIVNKVLDALGLSNENGEEVENDDVYEYEDEKEEEVEERGFFGAKNSSQDKIEFIKAENERINKALTDRYNYRASAISQNNLNDALLNLMAKGGKLKIGMDFTNGVRFIEEGGSHEQNPLGGVPQGVAMDGLFNLVEEGEVIYDDYVFSKRLNVPDIRICRLFW